VIVAGPFLSPLLTALAKRGVLNRQKGAFQTAAPNGSLSMELEEIVEDLTETVDLLNRLAELAPDGEEGSI